jgi:hypothetical protein
LRAGEAVKDCLPVQALLNYGGRSFRVKGLANGDAGAGIDELRELGARGYPG